MAERKSFFALVQYEPENTGRVTKTFNDYVSLEKFIGSLQNPAVIKNKDNDQVGKVFKVQISKNRFEYHWDYNLTECQS
jgi:hypothetical protein